MKSAHKEIQPTEVEVVDDIICNKCGGSLRLANGFPGLYGLKSVRYVGGYASPKVEDGNVYEFDLCEDCLVGLMASFKHDAYVGNAWFSDEA